MKLFKLTSFVILACVVVELVSVAAHEFGHWIVGMAYGMNGHLLFLQGENFASIVWLGSPNIVMSAAGGIFSCTVLIIMLGLSSLIKNKSYKYGFIVLCSVNLLVHFVYFLHETFTLNETWAVLFAIVGVIIAIEIIIKGIKDDIYAKTV